MATLLTPTCLRYQILMASGCPRPVRGRRYIVFTEPRHRPFLLHAKKTGDLKGNHPKASYHNVLVGTVERTRSGALDWPAHSFAVLRSGYKCYQQSSEFYPALMPDVTYRYVGMAKSEVDEDELGE